MIGAQNYKVAEKLKDRTLVNVREGADLPSTAQRP